MILTPHDYVSPLSLHSGSGSPSHVRLTPRAPLNFVREVRADFEVISVEYLLDTEIL